MTTLKKTMPTIDQARIWYPASDPVHGFDHVLRVYHLAERLALAEGADLEIVRAAALLHDVTGNQAQETGDQSSVTKNHPSTQKQKTGVRLNHHHASAEFSRQVLEGEGWDQERILAVGHCIRAHRFRDNSEKPQTLEAQVLFDADKLDAIGAIGVARAIAFAAHQGQPAFAQPSPRFLQKGEGEPGEVHSAYHEYLFKLRKLKDRLYTPTARHLAEQRHRYMADFFERLAAETQGQS